MTAWVHDEQSDDQMLAEAVRRACFEVLLEAYEQASMDGLCHEGAFEYALAAMHSMDLRPLIQRYGSESSDQPQPLH